ncbi:MAG: WhiB family transcriptional regulator [Actinomycetota bacterium]|nr:WhiB family transcriptional regulator [Actinomycetota bacterium]
MSAEELSSLHWIPAAPIEWMDHAACKGHTPLFFAPKAERPQARERREAKARRICDRCPVLSTCRQHARGNHEYGFWAGESEEDRHLAGFTVSAPIGVRARAMRS